MPYANKQIFTRPPLPVEDVERNVFVSRVKVNKKPKPLRSDIPGIKVLGAGFSPGSKLVRNEDLANLGYDSDWIIQRTGIMARHHVAAGEATSDMAIRAADQCLKNAGVDPSDVDLIIVATVTPDYVTPSTACIVQSHLGCQASAFDINAACSGFIYGLVTASQFVKSGCSRNALVIGAETLTTLMNPQDKKTYPLFGDGAGAVLISGDTNPDPSKASGILAQRLASEGKLGGALLAAGGGSRKPFSQQVLDQGEHFLEMDGRAGIQMGCSLGPGNRGRIVGQSVNVIERH